MKTMKTERTRRNVVKMGAILVSATAASVAAAKPALARGRRHHRWVLGGDPNCLLRGTTIRTADGDRKIEDLKIGDLLPTKFGGTRPIRWIARYPFKKSDPAKPWVKSVQPIRIARSALAPNVPENDLYVTSGHALLLDGLLIQVGNLINGATIARDEARERDELEYFQIKLDGHDVIYAEGAPVETMLKADESAVNFAEYHRLYGVPEAEAARCAPFATYGGGRGEFKSRIRSAVSPWLDRREPIDVIRDRLEERAFAAA
jgi:hypothetical protein